LRGVLFFGGKSLRGGGGKSEKMSKLKGKKKRGSAWKMSFLGGIILKGEEFEFRGGNCLSTRRFRGKK